MPRTTSIGWIIGTLLVFFTTACGPAGDYDDPAAEPAGSGASAAGGGAGEGGAAGATGPGGQAGSCDDHCGNAVTDCGELDIDCGGDCDPCDEQLSIRGGWLGLRGADGTWRVGITTGQLRYSDNLFDLMLASGKNVFNNNVSGAGGYGKSSAQAYLNGHFEQGWNEAFWDQLRAQFEEAESKGMAVIVNIWGTVALEGQRDADCWDDAAQQWTCRWDVNPYNAKLGKGGPYNVPGCGKDAFYTLPEYGTFVYEPGEAYPAAADMSTRGQWRQEQYVHRLASLCSEFSNTAISLMWEAGDRSSHTWGDCSTTKDKVRQWHEHMAQLIHSVSPQTLVATGSGHRSTELFTAMDFLTAEDRPFDLAQWWEATSWDKPVVFTGWAVWSSAGVLCGKTCEPAAYDYARGEIREAWAHGIQLGSPFWEYKDDDVYAVELDPYFVALRQLVDTVQSWDDEPGAEVTVDSLPPP